MRGSKRLRTGELLGGLGLFCRRHCDGGKPEEGGTEWGGGGRVEEEENWRATAQVRFRQVPELAGTRAPAPTERVALVGPSGKLC